MASSISLSPRSVLHFADQLHDTTDISSFQRREKRKRSSSLEDDYLKGDKGEQQQQQQQQENRYQPLPQLKLEQSFRSINLRHQVLCDRTVEWLVAKNQNNSHNTTISATHHHHQQQQRHPPHSHQQQLEELWLGPVFDSPQTLLLTIQTIPSSVTHLDLDLRNCLSLLPRALSMLFDPSKRHIQSLSLRFFGDSGAMELCKWIHQNPNLQRLDLRGNRIGTVGMQAIGKALSSSTSCGSSTSIKPINLKYLNLSCNCLVNACGLKQLLLDNKSLECLDLNFNWMGDSDVLELCEGLKKNQTLRELRLFGCQRITKVGMQAILDCIQEWNCSIYQLEIQVLNDEMHHLYEEIQHWLSLNRAGRCLVQQAETISPAVWPLVLANSAQNSNALYYLMRQGVCPLL